MLERQTNHRGVTFFKVTFGQEHIRLGDLVCCTDLMSHKLLACGILNIFLVAIM